MQNVGKTLSIVWRFLKKLNMELPHNAAIPLLVYTQEKLKRVLKEMLVQKISFVIAKKWKQLKFPSMNR